MIYKRRMHRATNWLGATCVSAIALLNANAAFAACTYTSGAVVCDTSAPNPSSPIAGSDILLLPGAQVEQDPDPYAGASVPSTFDTVTVYADGKLETRETSRIGNFFSGAASVAAGARSAIQLNGGIGNSGTNGIGLRLGENASLTISETGALYAGGVDGTALLVSGTGAKISVDGLVGNSYNGTAISMFRSDVLGNVTVGTADIVVSATGIVRATIGTGIILSSGSSVNVAGIVRSEGAGNAIEYRGDEGGSANVFVQAGGVLESRYQPTVIGSTGSLNLTIAGSVNATETPIAIQLGAANDTVTLVTGSSVSGMIDAGAGTDTLVLAGNGSATLGDIGNFETANAASGIWTLAAPLRVANGLTISAGATVVGSTEQFASPVVADGTLQLDLPRDATFSGAIGGNGQLIKSGTGTLTLGNQSFSGSTLISQGRLALAGNMPSAITVARGGTLTGQGLIRGLLVQSGGMVAPGSASNIGTLTVTGNYVQNAGSTYLTKAVNGTFDTIVIGGTATLDNGAILNITANGTGIGRYTLLRADGGLTGTYSVVQADITGAYSLIYGSNSLMLNIGRSNQALLALAQGRNGLAVASSVIQLSQASQLYTALATADGATVAGAYDQLAGNIYAAVPAAMLHGVDLVSGAALKRTGSGAGLRLWGQLLGSTGDMSGTDLLTHVEQRSYGGLVGVEGALGNVVVGVAGGYVHTKLRQETADARVEMPQALLYARAALPHIEMQAGIGYSRASNHVSRSISFADFSAAEKGRYKGDVIHGYGELGVPVKLGNGAVTPFAAGRFYRVSSNGLTELGGAAALRIDDSAHWSGMSELGTRISSPIVGGVSAYGRLSWQHRIGSYDDPIGASFAAGGSQFDVYGAQLSKDAASLGMGLGWTGARGLTIAAGYDGTIGDRGHDNAGRITLSIPL